jgi:group I intron endonuclease
MSLKKDKKDILKDHEVKQGGVYLLFNKLNNHFYVGSTVSIKRRMKNYLNISYLNLQQNNNMPITKALLKYNYDSFSLIIIEYLLDSAPSRMHCIRNGDESSPITLWWGDDSELKERETYWIKNLKPYYNVLQEGYRSVGYRHSEETKDKLRNLALGRLHLESTKLLISQALKGDKNPFYCKKHSLSSKDLISTKKSHGFIFVYDSLYNFLAVFNSLILLAKTIKANNNTLNLVLNKDRLFRGNWYIRNKLVFNDDLPLIKDKYSIEYLDLIKDMIKTAHIKQAIFVFNSITKEFVRKYDGIILAEKKLKIRHELIRDSIKEKRPIGNYIFSYDRFPPIHDANVER